MCGICGKISLNQKPVEEKEFKEMAGTLSHRGPDGEGFYLSPDKTVGLRHRRLAIIDLETGQQPMTNEDGTIWLVFNGEIYNFLELRKNLGDRGHQFRTQSDAEVIIHAYEEHDQECVDFFNGMFAFAIWDERRQVLFLARDRLGQKPLFYTRTPSAFLFASEVKALLKNPEVKKEIDFEALSCYLSVGYFLSPLTIIREVKKLPAASTLIFQNGRYKVKEYWDLDPTEKTSLSEAEWLEKFEELLEDSVKKTLMADVPLGAFLSGGIDSTTIVNFMRKSMSSSPKTFSVGFREPTYNELRFARQASRFLETDHRDLVVEPNIQKILPEIVWANDEPLGDTSAIPMFFLSRMTREKVKVALSGDGGDENLAGYETYIADKIFPFFKNFPLRYLVSSLVLNLLPTSFSKVSLDYKIRQFVRAANFTPERAHYSWRQIFSDEEKKKLLAQDVHEEIEEVDTFSYFQKYFDKYRRASFLDRAQYVDIKTWLADDILVKVDRATMGNSLEARAPFLDHRLVEFLANAPAELKLKGFQTKYLLKKLMKGRIPNEIIQRPKAGFNAPIPVWLRKDLKPLVLEYFSEEKIQKLNLFNYRFVQSLMSDYFSGRKDNSLKLWLLLNFVIWHKMFIHDGGR